MAENLGGTCMTVPMKACIAASMAARSGRSALVSVVRPSVSSVSVSAPHATVKL